ncbi:cell division protein ZapE [uncultured Microbacterium sp.]|uniref:cell division protein ZapE n=1 Tax=uncultured Microbacterium sp. TaxID=191216 RepID=UPI0025EC9E4E|nr:cell division protein ZapE [uncultured Microbacterium sp.]
MKGAAHPLTASPVDLATRLPEGLTLDAAQRAAAQALDAPHRHGVYLYGPVGRGKTVLAEAYLDALPTRRRRRVHMHDFFRDLQGSLGADRIPLPQALDRLVGRTRVLLFDEFHVDDVADAVYLAATVQHVRERGILLVATSNETPAELLPGVWHERFVPTIDLIERHLDVIPIGEGADYRRTDAGRPAIGFAAGSWIVADPGEQPPPTLLAADGGIEIPVRAQDGDRIVASFDDLCRSPLGTAQYLWLAERATGLRLVDVPDLSGADREALLRFCHLVDVLHDRDVRLDVRAAAPAESMSSAAVPPRALQRTLSRLAMLARGTA